MTVMARWVNGNGKITIHDDGTKIREWPDDEVYVPEYPEHFDLKITNFCTSNCPWCHEASTPLGTHGDLGLIIDKLNIPAHLEIAIGGGNPFDHPELEDFLREVKAKGHISNITINERNFENHSDMIERLMSDKLLHGVGFSMINHKCPITHPNIVNQVIIGVNNIDNVIALLPEGSKLSILGYKDFGRGRSNMTQKTIRNMGLWYQRIWDIMGRYHVSFDNLALSQLNLKRRVVTFDPDMWKNNYLGVEGTAGLYVDAVMKKFSLCSYSPKSERYNLTKPISLKEMFEMVRV